MFCSLVSYTHTVECRGGLPTPPLRAPPPTDADPTSRGPTSACYCSLMIFISWKLNAHILFVLLYNPDPEYQKITFSYAISKRKLQAHKIAYWKMELYVLNNQLFISNPYCFSYRNVYIQKTSFC